MNRRERREKNKEINILEDLVRIIKQYFPELINKFDGLTDLRNQSYIKYTMKVIFIVRLLGLMSEMKSMHGMTRELNTKESIKNIAQICNLELEEIPHCDTINDVFEKIKVEEIEEISCKESGSSVVSLFFMESKSSVTLVSRVLLISSIFSLSDLVSTVISRVTVGASAVTLTLFQSLVLSPSSVSP